MGCSQGATKRAETTSAPEVPAATSPRVSQGHLKDMESPSIDLDSLAGLAAEEADTCSIKGDQDHSKGDLLLVDDSEQDTECESVVADLPSDVTTVFYSNPLMRARSVDADGVRPFLDTENLGARETMERLEDLFEELLLFQDYGHDSCATKKITLQQDVTGDMDVTEEADGWPENSRPHHLVRIREVIAELRRGERCIDADTMEAAYQKVFQEHVMNSDGSPAILYARFRHYLNNLARQIDRQLGCDEAKDVHWWMAEARASTLPVYSPASGCHKGSESRRPPFAIHYDGVTPAQHPSSLFFSSCYVAQPCCSV